MECHKCRFNGLPDSPEKRKACHNCHPAESLTRKGKCTTSLDFVDDTRADNLAMVEIALKRYRLDDEAPFELGSSEDARLFNLGLHLGALRLLFWMESYDPDDLSLALMAMQTSLAEIGRQRKKPCTRANISLAWRKVVERHPELVEVVESNDTRERTRAGASATRLRAPAHKGGRA